MPDHSESKPSSVTSIGSNRIVVMRLSIAVWIILVVILLGLSFWGGALYGNEVRNAANSSGLTSSSNTLRRRYAVGLVVYISPTSITISNEDTNFNQTFAITDKTLISINGAKSSAAKIQPGNIVLIQEDKYDATKAYVILVNSHFSG